VDAHVRKQMDMILREIRSGNFARKFISEMATGRNYRKLLRAANSHPIERVGRRLRRRMLWKNKNKPPEPPRAAASG
jgi:ketol-acid reductoisomerase